MIAVTEDGNVVMGPLKKFLTGWRLRQYNLDQDDVATLANMPDQEALASLRQLAARTNRILTRPSGDPVEDTKGVVRIVNRRQCSTCGGDCGQC